MQPLTVVEVDPQGTAALSLLREAAVEVRALYPELFEQDAPWPSNGPNPAGGLYLIAYEGQWAMLLAALWTYRPLHGGYIDPVLQTG